MINRYRKTNLFTEPQFNVTSVPEIATFTSDFGVRFGTFICFDILFHEPALQLTRLYNITDIIYPTAWFSEMPFLTGEQDLSRYNSIRIDSFDTKSIQKLHATTQNIITYSSCTNTSRMVIC